MAGASALPSERRLRLRVAAENCRGGPRMIVRADGEIVADTTIAFGHDSEALGRVGDPTEI